MDEEEREEGSEVKVDNKGGDDEGSNTTFNSVSVREPSTAASGLPSSA
jgi:hypothetical protein